MFFVITQSISGPRTTAVSQKPLSPIMVSDFIFIPRWSIRVVFLERGVFPSLQPKLLRNGDIPLCHTQISFTPIMCSESWGWGFEGPVVAARDRLSGKRPRNRTLPLWWWWWRSGSWAQVWALHLICANSTSAFRLSPRSGSGVQLSGCYCEMVPRCLLEKRLGLGEWQGHLTRGPTEPWAALANHPSGKVIITSSLFR